MTETEIEALKTDISWIKKSLEAQAELLERIEKRLDEGSDKCRSRHEKIDRELGDLHVRASMVGTIAGLISGGAITIFGFLFKLFYHP